MSSANQVQVMSIEEFADNIWAKCKWHSAVIFSPSLYILVWIRPQQITEQTCKSFISCCIFNWIHFLLDFTQCHHNRTLLLFALHWYLAKNIVGVNIVGDKSIQLWIILINASSYSRDIDDSVTMVFFNVFTCVRDIGGSHYPSDLLHALQIWREASMAAENLFIDNSSNWQAIEAIRKSFPQLYIVSAFALVVKSCAKQFS